MKSTLSLLIVLFLGINSKVHSNGAFSKEPGIEYRSLNAEVSNNIYVLTKIRINGQNRLLRFIIDTGSTTTSISKQIADELKLEIIEKDSATDGYSYQEFGVVQLDLDIEGLHFNGIKADVLEGDLSGGGQVCEIDGILGSNVLREHVWSFRRGEVGVQSKVDKEHLSGFSKYKMKLFFGGVPTLVAGCKGTRSTSMIDLGFNGNITIPESQLQYLWGKQEKTGKGQLIQTAFNNHSVSESKIVKVPEFDFGNPKEHKKEGDKASIQGVIVDVENEEHFAMLSIGAGILNSYEMIIDYPKEKLYVKKIEESKEHSILDTFGFVLSPETMSVVFIWNDSPASQMGLNIGDKVEKLNDLNLSASDFKMLSGCERQAKISAILRQVNTVDIVVRNDRNEQVKGRLKKSALFKN